MKALTEIRREIAYLNGRLQPIADRPVDINDPHWMTKLVRPDPLDRAGVKAEMQGLLPAILARYVDGTESDRGELRRMFQEFSSFSWAATPQEAPVSGAWLWAHLVLLSIQDQGQDPRDLMMGINVLKAKATQGGLDFETLLTKAADLSSSQDRYGMGSTRQIMLSQR